MLGFSNSYFTNTTFFGTDCIFFSFQTVISPIQHSLVQIAKFVFSNSYFTNTAFLGTDCKMFFFPNSYFTNTAFLGTDCKMGFFFQTFISPIQHSLVQIVKCCFFPNSYFTNTTFFGTDCKIIFFQTVISPIQHSLVQIVKWFFFKQLFHQYSILWYRLQKCWFFSNSNFTNTELVIVNAFVHELNHDFNTNQWLIIIYFTRIYEINMILE
jgi:hypothetical protein